MAILNGVLGAVANQGGTVPIEATGGTITTHGIYKVHTFTSSGTFQITANPAAATMDVLMVGGGGGSKRNYTWIVPGGGGGGSLRTSAGAAGTVKSFTIVIGAGGWNDQRGGVTTMTDFTDCGGGAFCVDDNAYSPNATNGGAGAGRGTNIYGGGTNPGSPGVNGGDGGSGDNENYQKGGSGGGGAGGSGGGDGSDGSTTSTHAYGGVGADGLTNVYQTGVAQNYAGGGGGGAIVGSGFYYGAAGGDGGGGYGRGQSSPGGGAGTDGTANTGGGSGGKYTGTGGSGIVVIRYLA